MFFLTNQLLPDLCLDPLILRLEEVESVDILGVVTDRYSSAVNDIGGAGAASATLPFVRNHHCFPNMGVT